MTGKELDQLWYLKREIERDEHHLHQLKVDREIDNAKVMIATKQIKAVVEYNRLMQYISTIDDSYIRQIMELRHVHLYSWVKVARIIGGNNTADSVRKAHDRYLKKH